MRTVREAVQEKLNAGISNLCLCVRIVRTDEEVFGATTHVEDLELDGVTYSSIYSFLPTTFNQTNDLAVDSFEYESILSAMAVSLDDIKAGLFDDARIYFFMTDWADPVADDIEITAGLWSSVNIEGGRFRVEYRSLHELLQQRKGRVINPVCDAVFGDARCGFDFSSLTESFEVESVNSNRSIVPNSSFTAEPAKGTWQRGQLIWTSGANNGFKQEVFSYVLGAEREIVFFEAAINDIEAGDTFDLSPGCNKTKEACQDFENIINFRGFPDIPGTYAIRQIGRSKG